MIQAEEGVDRLKDEVDTLIVIPNQKIIDVVKKEQSLTEAFALADSVLAQGVQSISDLITIPGLINVDFADVRAIMTNAGTALMGIGISSGENRARKAAEMAINSPLLEVNIEGARGVLFNITGNKDISMAEVNEAANLITQSSDPDANIIFGTTIREEMKDEIKISVIATGFDQNRAHLQNLMNNVRPQFVPVEDKPLEEIKKSKKAPKELKKKPLKKIDMDKIEHSEVEIEDDLDIPAFLRNK